MADLGPKDPAPPLTTNLLTYNIFFTCATEIVMHTSQNCCENQEDNGYKSTFKSTRHSLHIKNHYYKYVNYLKTWQHICQMMLNERGKQHKMVCMYVCMYVSNDHNCLLGLSSFKSPQCQGPHHLTLVIMTYLPQGLLLHIK